MSAFRHYSSRARPYKLSAGNSTAPLALALVADLVELGAFGALDHRCRNRRVFGDVAQKQLPAGAIAARAQLDPGAQRMRPIGDVDARLGALRATRCAVAEVDALGAPVIFGCGDRDVGRPPMPTQSVHRLRVTSAGFPQRHGWHGGLMR